MNELLHQLLELQTLDADKTESKQVAAAKAALRAKIPPQVLGHYDRLADRGKKPLAAVNGQVCAGCHMRVPLGAIMTLKRGDDIQLCESCGRYIYLPPEAATPAVAPLAEPPKKRGRKPKKSLQAV